MGSSTTSSVSQEGMQEREKLWTCVKFLTCCGNAAAGRHQTAGNLERGALEPGRHDATLPRKNRNEPIRGSGYLGW